MRTSRRELVKWITASGIVLSLSRLASAQQPPFAARERLPGRGSWNPAATGMGRIDGVPKVTGAKLYASDFRAADLPGWPAYTSHAILVRAPDATHVYTGLDLARLSGALKPSVVVSAAELAQVGARVPEVYAGDLLCPLGRTPLYLGQPVAMLLFEQAQHELEKTIAEALDGHLCRCTGYIKYHEAVRDVILADPGRYLVAKVDRDQEGMRK